MNGINYYPIVRTEGTKIIFNLNTEKMENVKESDSLFNNLITRFRDLNGRLDRVEAKIAGSTRSLGGDFGDTTPAQPGEDPSNVENKLGSLNTETQRFLKLVNELEAASDRLVELV